MPLEKILYRIQGLYYLFTGLWPLLSMGTFMDVTGSKTDQWLVRTVGGLAAASGLGFFVESLQTTASRSAGLFSVAIGECVAFLLIDVVEVLQHKILSVYLLDAFAEALLIALWCWARWSGVSTLHSAKSSEL